MSNQPSINDIHEALGKDMPYKWRVQSFSKHKASATCVAYVDSRDVQRRLDEVVGADKWQDDYKEIKGNLYAGIGIKVSDEWVWKWDCGTESEAEAQKGEASDSFKRAAVKWNIGRFLYELDIKYVKTNEIKTSSNRPYVVDDNGKKVWDISSHINGQPDNTPSRVDESFINKAQLQKVYTTILHSEEFNLEEKAKGQYKESWDEKTLVKYIMNLSFKKSERQKSKVIA